MSHPRPLNVPCILSPHIYPIRKGRTCVYGQMSTINKQQLKNPVLGEIFYMCSEISQCWKYMYCRCQATIMKCVLVRTSLVPRPRPAFRCLQYGKVGRAWYLLSRDHDVIGKWWNFQNKRVAFCILFNWLHAQCSVYTTIALRYMARYVG